MALRIGWGNTTTRGGRVPRRLVGLIVVAVVSIALAAVVVPSDLGESWRYFRAERCAEGALAESCLADIDGVTTNRVTTRSADGSSLRASVTVSTSDGGDAADEDVVVRVSNRDADRLGITGAGQDVALRLFEKEAVRITGPNGESAAVEEPSSVLRLGLFVVLVAVALIALVSVAAIVFRRRGLDGQGESAAQDERSPDTTTPSDESLDGTTETSESSGPPDAASPPTRQVRVRARHTAPVDADQPSASTEPPGR